MDSLNAPALGVVTVSVWNADGWSNAVTFEFVHNDPPVVDVRAFTNVNVPLTWDLAGEDLSPAQLLVAINDNSTVLTGGFSILSNAVVVSISQLDELGFGSYTRLVPPSIPNGSHFYSQLVVFDAVTGNVSAVSSIKNTQVGPFGG